MKTIMLIGCTGLIGTALTKRLIQEGYCVVGYSRSRPQIEDEHFFSYQGELSELSTMIRIMQRHNVDTVIHNAALSHPKMAQGNPYKMFQINLLGVLNSIEAASVANVNRYLFASAAGVYGNNVSDPILEDMPLKSECAYDSAKIAAEEVVKNYGIECGILRIGFVYGPGRVHECPIAMLLREVRKNGMVKWQSGADQYLDYIYLDDAIEGFVGAVGATRLQHKIYNLGGGRLTPYHDVVSIVQKLYPEANIQIGPGGLGYDDIGRMDNSRAQEDFGYVPRVTLEEGIRVYNDWIIKSSI